MNHPVLLKGNSIGLTMVLDPEMKFEQLKAAICEKFTQAKDFFNGPVSYTHLTLPTN